VFFRALHKTLDEDRPTPSVAKMQPNDCSFWHYVDIHGVPWVVDIKQKWGSPKWQFSVLSVTVFSAPLEIRPTLLHSNM